MNITDLFDKHSHDLAICAHDTNLSHAQLFAEVTRIAGKLQGAGMQRVGLYADNSAAWICIDLACMLANIILVPIPLFFSSEQITHLLDTADLDVIFTDRTLPRDISLRAIEQTKIEHEFVLGLKGFTVKSTNTKAASLASNSVTKQKHPMPNKTAKVTFTSGSTGQPKGVCLSASHQLLVAKSLVSRVGVKQPRHLVALPLSTLLENIAGVYAPLLARGTLVVPNENQRGFSGSQLSNVQAFLKCISESQANTLITVPELLKVMVAASSQGWQPPSSFTFIAVGGAKVARALVQSSRQLGLPVYQGYGLSECASVVSLAGPSDPPDSCGKPLEHVKCALINNELLVKEHVFLGYLGEQDSWYSKQVNTGDIVRCQDEQLFIEGRRKLQIINSMGRNISPEWAESLILANPAVHQACIIGEARPYCIAIISLHGNAMSLAELAQYLIGINRQLPDYAKVRKVILLGTPMSLQQNLITANGRIKRDAATTYFSQQIDLAYQSVGADSVYPDLKYLVEQEFIHDTI
ncbi:AMP-binding protein [Glaciecola sp. SC05]|uniref:AMP-binding protein n=1 Tax=Glaciecola sp. SC05 TaxID=1987355 RepID=UPI003528B93A